MAFFTEDDLEQLSMEWFTEIGYEVKTGNEISHTGLYTERDNFNDVILNHRLETALRKITELNTNAIQQAIHKISIEQSQA